jgi:general secretion pathway protein I
MINNFQKSQRPPRAGLSLLEVVLALAILGIAVGILAQAMQLSADNATRSQLQAQAQLMCESKMSEIVAGAIQIQPQDWMPISGIVGTGQWYYSIQTTPAAQPNMIGVVVTVTDNISNPTNNVNNYQLVRWVIDPNLGLDQLPDPAETGTGTQSSGSSGATGASGSASGGQ